MQGLRCARFWVGICKGYSKGVQGLGCARIMACKCKGVDRLGFGRVRVWKGSGVGGLWCGRARVCKG